MKKFKELKDTVNKAFYEVENVQILTSEAEEQKKSLIKTRSVKNFLASFQKYKWTFVQNEKNVEDIFGEQFMYDFFEYLKEAGYKLKDITNHPEMYQYYVNKDSVNPIFYEIKEEIVKQYYDIGRYRIDNEESDIDDIGLYSSERDELTKIEDAYTPEEIHDFFHAIHWCILEDNESVLDIIEYSTLKKLFQLLKERSFILPESEYVESMIEWLCEYGFVEGEETDDEE